MGACALEQYKQPSLPLQIRPACIGKVKRRSINIGAAAPPPPLPPPAMTVPPITTYQHVL